jgi:RNA-directed DNA polymerase
MTIDSPHLYRATAAKLGIPPETADNAIREFELLRNAGVTPVLTLGHLAHLTGAKHSFLRAIVERRIDPYEEFTRMRRNGGKMRTISSPDPVLMEVQRWILSNVLSRIEPHQASYAYTRRRSVGACARRHIGARFMIKLDLHDFFHSIDEYRVFSLYRDLGFNRLVSLELSRICTRHSKSTPRPPIPAPHTGDYLVIPKYRVDYLGFLPQGGATSGALANLAVRRMDHEIQYMAADYRLTYTRYADDLVLSGADEFSRDKCRDVVRLMRRIVSHNGFHLHEKKTRLTSPGGRKVVLGVTVTDTGIKLSREVKARLNNHLYGATKFGISRHASSRGFTSTVGFVRHIRGLLAYAQDIDPDFATPLAARWRAVEVRDGTRTA